MRTCAGPGCKTEISGLPFKIYCSRACNAKAVRRRYSSERRAQIRIDNRRRDARWRQLNPYASYQRGSRAKGREFDLTVEQFYALFGAACRYCGIAPSKGIDRLNSADGYVVHNSVPCCAMCNTMKLDYTEEEFLEQVSRINNRRGGNNAS